MQLLLGLFFFSILVTTGSSLQCPFCVAFNGYCSDVKHECDAEEDICMNMTYKSEDNKYDLIVQDCGTKDECKEEKDSIGEEFTADFLKVYSFDMVIKSVVCSSAPPAFASFFPAFLGLLLMKLLC